MRGLDTLTCIPADLVHGPAKNCSSSEGNGTYDTARVRSEAKFSEDGTEQFWPHSGGCNHTI